MSGHSAIAAAAGEAQWLPVVRDITIEPSLGVLTCQLYVPTDLPIFAGHFPGTPIVPGVIQVGWVVSLAREHELVSAPFAGIVFAKFRRILKPGIDLRARLEPGRSMGVLQFEFTMGDFMVSCGRLRFGRRP